MKQPTGSAPTTKYYKTGSPHLDANDNDADVEERAMAATTGCFLSRIYTVDRLAQASQREALEAT